MTIIEAIKDEKLFRPFLADKDDSLKSWKHWMVLLRALYGLPITAESSKQLIRDVTGRDPDLLPEEGFSTALFLTGRRSGKSRNAAVIGAFEAVLAGHERKLARGEKGLVLICSPTKSQSRIVKSYIRSIFETPLLAQEVVAETQAGFELRNGVRIELLAGDYRTVRGFTILSAIIDEAAFFGLADDSKVKSDSELIRAIKPALATTGGRLVAISSPYARKGWTFSTYKKHFGNDASKSTLVVNCPSRTLNATLPQSVIDEAMAEDMAAAKSEYMGEFRDSVSAYLPRELVERLVVKDRKELEPNRGERYHAFVDISGGRGDDAALAISHRREPERVAVLDLLRHWKSPFNPYQVVQEMSEDLKRFGLRQAIGDAYSAEFLTVAFNNCGIRYGKCDRPKAQLYLELLPRLCSGEVELLDNELLVNQLASLERRTRSGGRDIVDHPSGPGYHDDLANAAAGAITLAGAHVVMLGGF